MTRLGDALAAPLEHNTVAPTTLQTTMLQRSVAQNNNYRTLVSAAGESYVPRFDVLGKSGQSGRTSRRRSLAYLGHMSDIHIIDAQSPARIEPLSEPLPSTFAGSIRPQGTMTVHVQA